MEKEEKMVVTEEIARLEVEKWMDLKRVRRSKRLEYEANIEDLVEAICDGDLSLDEDHNFIQKLRTEITDNDGEVFKSSFKYKPRLSVKEVEDKLKGVKSTNHTALISAYVSALTGENSGVIKKMDTGDNSIAQSIAIFFL